MGGQQSQVLNIDPSQAQRQQQQFAQVEEQLRRAFSKHTQNGRLTRDKFNEALAVLETYNFKRLRDTPLSDRLYSVFDDDQSGYLSEKEYLQGLTMLINDKEKRIIYSFKIYDRNTDNRIDETEFFDLIKDSWITAFRLLAENYLRGPNPQGLNQQKINSWAQSQLNQLYQRVHAIFKCFDQNNGYLDAQTFRQWVMSNEMSFVKAQIQNTEVIVPLHLYKLEG